jgi:transcription elongation factor GreA
MKAKISITKQGREELEGELKELLEERPGIVERIATARAFGDLSENEEYSSARAEQKTAENRIAEIEELLKNAEMIAEGDSREKVELGATVLVENKGKEITYIIVSTDEAANFADAGKISDESPLGRALLGKKAGESAILETPKGGNEFKIISIS